MEDWANLLEHAINADGSPSFQHWLRHRSAWQWQPPAEQADHPEEALVRNSSPISQCACTSLLVTSQNRYNTTSLKLITEGWHDDLPAHSLYFTGSSYRTALNVPRIVK